MSHDGASQLGLELPQTGRPWPPHARFPGNSDGQEVGPQLIEDLLASEEPLIVAGYASVERLLALAHDVRSSSSRATLRILIGVEPTARPKLPAARPTILEREIAEYWLNQGISITQWPAILAAIDLIDRGRLRARSSGQRRVHAKIYVGEHAATLGSSNFTDQGLSDNLEANVRFERSVEDSRYSQATDFAENLWSLGRDYTDGLRDLLSQLLKPVTWQEALARACAELLEGDWAAEADATGASQSPLWPSQEQGIAQALWVLENVGSVLIADATGAGKTRMGACLIRALRDRNWKTGRSPTQNPVLVCPPATKPRWRFELATVGVAMEVVSQGVLSRRETTERNVISTVLERTQLLVADEAHNFLNRLSERSRAIYGSAADHVILLTATPINRGVIDLVSMVDLLGADNFDDDVLRIVERLGGPGKKPDAMSDHERDRIRGALRTFVVRRTKRDFNELIDREPDRFKNVLGNNCRFPTHMAKTFRRDDPRDDRDRARAIAEHSGRLLGLVNLRRIELPRFLAYEGWSEENYLEVRLKGAAALAAYNIRSCLRSSRAALTEHVAGTAEAVKNFEIADSKSGPTVGAIARLQGYEGKLPDIRLSISPPAFLSNPAEYARALREEISSYRLILGIAEGMSDHRAAANARYLLELLEQHQRILAFDSHLISLFELKSRLEGLGATNVIVATGTASVKKRLDFASRFGLEAADERLIGLCSDAMAEGLNLQGASAVVHLDLPTVVRILEQRIGRVDRMDSPYASVEVHWPEEPPEFALRSDDRLFMRLRTVDELIGSNVPLPEDLGAVSDQSGPVELPLSDLIQAVERGIAEGPEVTLTDAFANVRRLTTGPTALVPSSTYEQLRHSSVRVLSCVSVVPAPHPWAFLAVGAVDRSVPRWLLIDLDEPGPPSVIADLDEVANALRERLEGEPIDLPFDDGAAKVLRLGMDALRNHQRELLPRRRRRALGEMETVLTKYRKRTTDAGRDVILAEVLGLLKKKGGAVDLDLLADWWLALVRPRWLQHLVRPKIRRPVQLKHIRKNLLDHELSTSELQSIRTAKLGDTPLERRVTAAIVGVRHVS